MVKTKPIAEGDMAATKHIKNRIKRQEVFQRIKKGKKDVKKAKKEQRKKDAEDPEKKNLPKQANILASLGNGFLTEDIDLDTNL
jgi:hypothetical protein